MSNQNRSSIIKSVAQIGVTVSSRASIINYLYHMYECGHKLRKDYQQNNKI